MASFAICVNLTKFFIIHLLIATSKIADNSNSITAINKKIENIEPAFIGIMHNQKDWQIEE